MARTYKDKPARLFWEQFDEDHEPRWAKHVRVRYYGTKRDAGKPNLTKGYESGPGGKNCACCGVNSNYKGQMRADKRAELYRIRKAL